MTQEQHQSHGQVTQLTEEQPVKRRSRSLSDLPGNIRVPILQRQDTSRTQARLEAGAAGVEELRILREHQQRMVDLTVKAAQQKRKKPLQHRSTHSLSGHLRSRQSEHSESAKLKNQNFCSSVSAWHSVSHLTSISEELDSTHEAVQKYFPGSSIKGTDNTNLKVNTEDAFANKNVSSNNKTLQGQSQFPEHKNLGSFPDKKECHLHDHIFNKNFKHHQTVEKYYQEKMFKKSGAVSTEDQTSADKYKETTQSELSYKHILNLQVFNDKELDKSSNNCIDKSRRCSMPGNYNQPNINNSYYSDVNHKQSVYVMTDQFYARNRSQSVNANFTFFGDEKENEHANKLSHQIRKTNHTEHNATNSQAEIEENSLNEHVDLECLKHNTRNKSECNNATSNNITVKHANMPFSATNSKPTTYKTQSSFHSLEMFSPLSQRRNKSISWDNLLVVIGLSNDRYATANKIEEQEIENDDNVFQNEPQNYDLKHEISTSSDMTEGYIVQRKKARSQSFTYGHSLNSNYKLNILKTQEPSESSHKNYGNSNYGYVSNTKTGIGTNTFNRIIKRSSVDHKRQATKEINPTSQLRRASIQCEAVLTQSGNLRKIVNPLQDVDINSIHSPGPLHAVTLQYRSLPMRNSLDRNVTSTYNNSAIPEEKLKPSENLTMIQASSSEITESCPTTEAVNLLTEDNCKVNTKDLCNSKHFHPSTQSVHLTSQTRTNNFKSNAQQINSITEHTTEKENNMQHKMNPVPTTSLSDKSCSSRDLNTSQNTNNVVQLSSINNSCNTTTVQNHHSVCLINTKETPNSQSENDKSPTNHNKKVSPNSTQNTDLNSSIQELNTKESVIIAESTKSKAKDLKEQEQEMKKSKILESLSLWVKSCTDRKTNANSSGDSPIINTNTSTNVAIDTLFHTPSFQNEIDHLTEDNSDMIKSNSNDSKLDINLTEQLKYHTPDTSILSDEGYSTFDSISQHSQLTNCGHHRSCDLNSPNYDTTKSLGISSNLSSSSVKSGSSLHTQQTPQKIATITLKHDMETRNIKFDTEVAKHTDNNRLNCFIGNIDNHNDIHNQTVIQDILSNQNYDNSSAGTDENITSIDRLPQRADASVNVTNQEIAIQKEGITACTSNNINSTNNQTSNHSFNKQPNEEVNTVTRPPNDSAQRTIQVLKRPFKQTAV